jgi:4-amino-4-deoxy-L-arabinose transferase-like glycosyltransferase
MVKDKHLIFVILAIAAFFLVNTLWIKLDNQLPIIGDDPRWLEETYRMTEVVKTGDLGKIWEKWQTMFIENTNSFPRTPLFTLMSVPVFLLTGPDENAAISLNAFVLAVSSLLLYFFVTNIFNGVKNKRVIAVFAVLLLNLFQGYYGFARLYMSEILQLFFVILICLYINLFKDRLTVKVWFGLGVLLALAMLLRFIMPIYLFLPFCYFLYFQIKQKKDFKRYLILLGAFCLGFLPLFLSWYARNFQTYLDFTKYTSSGDLAEISSLGPVFSLVTVARFWKVIALWHFGWTLLGTIGIIVVWLIGKLRMSLLNIFKGKNKTKKALLMLFLLPLPALIVSTLSINKTARYLLPVEVFWIIFIAFFVALLWGMSKKIGRIIIIGIFIILSYQFIQSTSTTLPNFPIKGEIYTTNKYLKADPKEEKYKYLFTYITNQLKPDSMAKFYLIPEQVQLNDAELIWYFTQKGYSLNTIGEFSSYTSLTQGIDKIGQADYVIIDNSPVIAEKYLNKYKAITTKVTEGNYIKITDNIDLGLDIFVRVY